MRAAGETRIFPGRREVIVPSLSFGHVSRPDIMRFSMLLGLVLAASSLVRTAHAQLEEELLYDPFENTRGFMLGLRGGFVPAMAASGERQFEGTDVATTWGSGYGVQLGYGYSPHLLFFGSVDQSTHESDNAQISSDITLYHFDFGARWHFRPSDYRIVPYVSLAIGGKQLYTHQFIDPGGTARRTTINARAIVPGGGLQVFFTENFAVEGNAAVSIGGFRRISIDGAGRQRLYSNGGVTSRISLGVNWYPND